MEFTLNNNIKKLIEMLGITPYAFSKSLGDKRPDHLYLMLKNERSVGGKYLDKVLSVYPEYKSLVMLGITPKSVSGEVANAKEIGLLYPDGEEIVTKGGNIHKVVNDEYMTLMVPLITERAYAGYLAGYADPEYIDTLEKIPVFVDKLHRGTYRAFTVSGDSMDDNSKQAISDGMIAVGRRILHTEWKNKIHLHDWKVWVIVHVEGIMIKHITEHNVENRTITINSYNPDKTIYPDRIISLDDVSELYNVVQLTQKL